MNAPSIAGDRLRDAFGALADIADTSAECQDAGRMWDAVTGAIAPEEARQHLAHAATCPSCAAVLRLARAAAIEAGLHVGGERFAVPPSAARYRSPRWLAAAAALVLLAAAALLIVHRSAEDPWSRVAISKAPYVHAAEDDLAWRNAPAGDSLSAIMDPYVRGDLAAAEEALASYLKSHPGHPAASFYHGVCLLMLGRPAQAVIDLESASLAGDLALRQDALWYLALADGKTGRHEEAIRRLRGIAAGDSPHGEEARRLLSRLGVRAPGAGP